MSKFLSLYGTFANKLFALSTLLYELNCHSISMPTVNTVAKSLCVVTISKTAIQRKAHGFRTVAEHLCVVYLHFLSLLLFSSQFYRNSDLRCRPFYTFILSIYPFYILLEPRALQEDSFPHLLQDTIFIGLL